MPTSSERKTALYLIARNFVEVKHNHTDISYYELMQTKLHIKRAKQLRMRNFKLVYVCS
jgi:hypothetical protein